MFNKDELKEEIETLNFVKLVLYRHYPDELIKTYTTILTRLGNKLEQLYTAITREEI